MHVLEINIPPYPLSLPSLLPSFSPFPPSPLRPFSSTHATSLNISFWLCIALISAAFRRTPPYQDSLGYPHHYPAGYTRLSILHNLTISYKIILHPTGLLYYTRLYYILHYFILPEGGGGGGGRDGGRGGGGGKGGVEGR